MKGTYLSVHLDLAGVETLIHRLEALRKQLLKDDSPDTHLFGYSGRPEGRDLTLTKLKDQPGEVNQVLQVKIYGWSDDWAKRHGLKP
jgi:hypothetical protein